MDAEESLDSTELRNMVFEESVSELLGELRSVREEEKTFRELLVIFFSTGNLDPWQVAALKNMQEIHSNLQIMQSSVSMLEHIQRVPRPYEQHYVTESGANRLTTENFETRFSSLATRYYRFSTSQIRSLIAELQIPEILVFNGNRTNSVEALCTMLHKLASHCRFVDIVFTYDRLPGMLSQIFNGMSVFIYRKWSHLVRTFKQPFTTDLTWLNRYEQSIFQSGCPLRYVAGFADGTCVVVAKPTRGQRSLWCGHHSHHCLKFLVIVYPCGLMTGFGPFDGSVHDSSIAREVRLDYLMEEECSFGDREFVLYLDAGFALGSVSITPFRRGRRLTAEQNAWNRSMSTGRISVEWGIGRVKEIWMLLTNKAHMRTLLQPVSIMVVNAILLTNILNIFNGSNIQSHFGVEPPTLREYLEGLPGPQN